MKSLLLFFILLIYYSTVAIAQFPFAVLKDKVLVKKIKAIDINNPEKTAAFFTNGKELKTRDSLGFGWTRLNTGICGDDFCVDASFYYFKDSIAAFKINAGTLPDHQSKRKKYIAWFKNSFLADSSRLKPYWHNKMILSRPLSQYTFSYKAPDLSGNLLNYMSPETGIEYGFANEAGILANRDAFNKIKDSLTREQLLLLMYSINPASRFTALEYYLKCKDQFDMGEDPGDWMEKLYNEIPEIEIHVGCIMSYKESTRLMVLMYSQINSH
jgi:hypothetical protein